MNPKRTIKNPTATELRGMRYYLMNDWVFGVRSVQVFAAELRGMYPERTIKYFLQSA